MNRKQFLQLLALTPVAGLVSRNIPKGSKMYLGDLILKHARGEDLSFAEWQVIGEKLKNIEAAYSLVSGWTNIGKTHPYFDYLEAHTGRFDILPHEAGTLYHTTAQSCATGEYTTLTFDTTATKSKSLGFGIDSSKIYIQGVPKNSLFVIIGYVDFGAVTNNTTVSLHYYKNGSSRVQIGSHYIINGSTAYVTAGFPDYLTSDNDYYEMQIYHNDAGAVNANTRFFGIVRIR